MEFTIRKLSVYIGAGVGWYYNFSTKMFCDVLDFVWLQAGIILQDP